MRASIKASLLISLFNSIALIAFELAFTYIVAGLRRIAELAWYFVGVYTIIFACSFVLFTAMFIKLK